MCGGKNTTARSAAGLHRRSLGGRRCAWRIGCLHSHTHTVHKGVAVAARADGVIEVWQVQVGHTPTAVLPAPARPPTAVVVGDHGIAVGMASWEFSCTGQLEFSQGTTRARCTCKRYREGAGCSGV